MCMRRLFGAEGHEMSTLEELAARLLRAPLQGVVPRRTGPEFVAEVAAFSPPAGTLAVWFLGQESVVWKAGGVTAWIDPYLSANPARRFDPLCAPQDVVAADLVLITHEHSDHLDPRTCAGIATAAPDCRFVAPPCCRSMLERAGIAPARILTPHTGEPQPLGSWRVTSVPAAHETVDWNDERGHRWTGYLVEVDGAGAYYHAGDTVICPEMLAALAPWTGRLELAMLPINGRDYFRNAHDILGNLTFREAAELAARLGAGVTVPLHYDLFHRVNEERPAHFLDYVYDKYPFLPTAVLAPGQLLLVPRR